MGDQKMQLVDWLDDLCVRFIINLPQEELESVARICFQVEEAQWFYEDFVRPIDPSLPSLHLKDFCLAIFQHCPLLSAFSDSQHLAAYQEFLGYKTRVPVRGAILLNHDMDHVLLVKGWKKGASWSFPRGKINKDEPDLDCAIREVYEETGYDVKAAGLADDRDAVKAIDVTMREQHMRLFVFRDVPMDTHFEPRTRKEISKIQWYRLSELPTFRKSKQNAQGYGQDLVNANKFYMVAPFLHPLKKWINYQRRLDAQGAAYSDVPAEMEEAIPEVETLEPLNIAPSSAIDPSSDLKRLLSVGVSPETVDPARNEDQAKALLTMLRGGVPGGLHPSHAAAPLPETPFDQITGFPDEPPTPQYNHLRETPQVRQQPPPQFPYNSPNGGYDERPMHRGIDPVAPYMAFNNHGINAMHASQTLQAAADPRTGIHAYSTARPQYSNENVQQYEAAPQETHNPLAHGPVAPKPSQLPPPSLTNHSMNLLNAFRGGPPQSVTGHNPPNLGSPLEMPTQPRNAHQNSLLDLFRKPADQSVSQQPDQASQNAAALPTVAVAPPTTAQRPPPPTQRRSSALNMITRTLPKVKLDKPSLPVPEMDAVNFPTLGGAPTQRAVTSPAPKQVQAQEAAPVRAPVAILQRPASETRRNVPVPHGPPSSSPHRPPSRGKPAASTPQPSFTILQRPSSAKSNASPRQASDASPGVQGREQQNKPFQPQLLRRPQPGEPQITSSDQSTDEPENKADQRDALLALFNKSSQIPAQTPPLVQQSPKPTGTAAWNDFSRVAQEDASKPTHHAPLNPVGSSPVRSQQRWNETFKKTSVGDGWTGGPRNIVSVEKTTHGPPAPARSPSLLSSSRIMSPAIGSERVNSPRAGSASGDGNVNERSRLGSAASIGSAGRGSIGAASKVAADGMRSPDISTPAEAKDFLLGFLKGVR